MASGTHPRRRTVTALPAGLDPAGGRWVPRPGSASLVRHLVDGGIPFALVLVYALRTSGSYGPRTFEQNGIIVWAVIALGVLVGYLPRERMGARAWLLPGALLLYAAWTALSLSWTDSSELTFQEIARCLDYLGVVVLLICLANRATWRSAVAGVGLAGLCVCIVSVGSRLDPSVFGHDAVDVTFGLRRLSVPFGYWNAVGAWAAMAAGFGLCWSAHDDNPIRRSLMLALVPVAVAAVYLSYSRAAVGGLALAALVSVLLGRHRITTLIHLLAVAAGSGLVILVIHGATPIANGTGQDGAGRVWLVLVAACGIAAVAAQLTRAGRCDALRIPRRTARYAGGAALAVIAIAAIAFGPRVVSSAWHSFTSGSVSTAAPTASPTARLDTLSGTRYQVWQSAWKAFDAHSLHGLGAGTFRFWFDAHGTGTQPVLDVHNLWLQNLAELGIVGLILIVAVALAALVPGIESRRIAVRGRTAGASASVLVVFLVFLLGASVDWLWQSTAVTVFALAGLSLAAGRLGRPRATSTADAPASAVARWRGPVLRTGLAALAAGALILQLPALRSSTDVSTSQTNAANGNLTAATADAHAAVAAEPWSADAYQQLALVQERAGRLRAATTSVQAAIRHARDDYTNWLILARLDVERAETTAALAAYRHARALSPRAAIFTVTPSLPATPQP